MVQSLLFALCALVACTGSLVSSAAIDYLVSGFRPPAIPLIVLNPTMSMWVRADTLTADYARHWSGSTMTCSGMARIDGTAYRFFGPTPDTVAAMSQSALYVTPTRTIAVSSAAGVQLTLTFAQTAFPDQPDYYARPYAYITVDVASIDGATHDVQIYFDHASDVLINSPGQKVDWLDMSGAAGAGTRVLRMGQYDQIPFINRGDATKNEWGYLYLASNSSRVTTAVQASSRAARTAFATSTPMPAPDTQRPRNATQRQPASVYVLDYGTVGSMPVSDYLVWAWDDVESMYYFHERQVPLWRYTYMNQEGAMLAAAFKDYGAALAMCETFDAQQLATLTKAGGQEYATFTALSHRQVTGATVVVWSATRQSVWAYMKEISSDGDVSTVDVIYPAAPLFVYYAPELLKQMLLPVLAYGQNETDIQYALPWAPHHLGTWPVSDITGPEQEQMPMEESANLLIMLAAIAQQQNNDVTYLKPYWPALSQWAHYLNVSLPDPGDQTCTDDFEGSSPHNVNLALKGILGLASFARLLNASGQVQEAALYRAAAEGYVQDWLRMGLDESGDHYRLQFDLKGTWSTKYNLMWQYALDLDLFPDSVAQQEVAWYLSHANQYGVPLDSRGDLSKVDWMSWAAAFATNAKDAQQILHYLYTFANNTESRVPFSDFYNSKTNQQIGFQARPVLGGLWARVLVLQQQQAKEQHASGEAVVSGEREVQVLDKRVRSAVSSARRAAAGKRHQQF